MSHHSASIIDNRNITASQIRSNERLQYNNHISYKQAYWTIKAVLLKLDGDEADCFGKLPAYLEQYSEAYEGNYAQTIVDKSGNFEAIFIAPGRCIHVFCWLRPIVRLNSAITKLQFQIQLLIVYSIDANNEVLLLV
jgi:hypothetical protein